MKTLIFLRHGKTAYTGQFPDLTDEGKEQIGKAAGEILDIDLFNKLGHHSGVLGNNDCNIGKDFGPGFFKSEIEFGVCLEGQNPSAFAFFAL